MRNPIVTKSVDRFSTQDMAKISCKTLAKGLSTDQFSTELFFLQKKLEILKTRITQFHQRIEGEVSTRDGLTGVLSLYEEVLIEMNHMIMKDTEEEQDWEETDFEEISELFKTVRKLKTSENTESFKEKHGDQKLRRRK